MPVCCPVGVIAFQFDTVVAQEFYELERSGADHTIAAAKIIAAQTLCRFLGNDVDRRQVGQYQGIRFLGVDFVVDNRSIVYSRIG
jgi:hypothetical protein